MKTKQRAKSTAWICDVSWISSPVGTLFNHKHDAITAGWKRPARVELTVRIVQVKKRKVKP